MKHTPGPWTAKENAYNYWGVYSPNETLLAEAPFKYRPANIRLMAAAPEMKDRLKEPKECLIYLTPWWEDDLERIEGVIDSINALLRRIEGDEEAK